MAVKKLVSNFERDSINSQKLLNKSGEQVGIIHLNFKNESDQTIILTNEQKLNISHAEPEYIYEQIQNTIDDKVKKYSKKYSADQKKWWLLIHDLKNFTNSDYINDCLSNEKFKITFFEKVLFMRNSYGVKISDLKKK